MPVIYRIPGKTAGEVEFHAKKGAASGRLRKLFGRGHGKQPTAIKISGRDQLCALLNNPADYDPDTDAEAAELL